ncbi:thymidine phosphorylase family protein [Alteromonas sp. a30]|uniref:thymidine phosphorylase family protein n=1 Tax=Alteromonas sp. a30 TaxID=2730917 RepID=UPI00227DCC61|nr:thymidine phosphorylase family protein [Alteromonas sp. a30]MCY7296438.1 thymidine phosphorylase family protein [Alteromonas sp. a30]
MSKPHALKVLDMGIETHHEPAVFIRKDSHVCKSEGFTASNCVAVSTNGQTLFATLNVVERDILPHGYAGFSKAAMKRLKVLPGDEVEFSHPPVLPSMSYVRKKIFGEILTTEEINAIVEDISEHRYRDIEIASFLSICAGGRLNMQEITDLTMAMVNCGKRIHWGKSRVMDKHCVGGVPGNRTTPLVVSIVSAAGLIIPKTSSRAITSPAGTADTVEVLTTVNLSIEEMKHVVDSTGGCLAWGGAVNLSPADDLLIRIEQALDLDGEGQLIASMLSKKIASGSTHAIIDIPVGATAKVRTQEDAERLADLFSHVGTSCGLQVKCIITDGSKPVGRGIGPAQEAKDLIAVLSGDMDAPQDLRSKGILLSAHLLMLADEEGQYADLDACIEQATRLLDSGAALTQFEKILNAQGGIKSIPEAEYQHTVFSVRHGMIRQFDNRKLARLAKLAGAPFTQASGLRLHATVGDTIEKGEPLFTVFSNSAGELDYALQYFKDNPDLITIT